MDYASNGANHINVLKDIMAQNAPKAVVDFVAQIITVYNTVCLDQAFLDNLIKYELFSLIKQMHEEKINLNIKDKYGKTAFHYACEHHDQEKIQQCITLGLSPMLTDRYDKTPIDHFFKTKPDPNNTALVALAETLLKFYVDQGGVIHKEALISAIKTKKFAPYHQVIDAMEGYHAPTSINQDTVTVDRDVKEDSTDDEDEELVEVTVYKTEKTIHYHRYSATVMVRKKDLVLDDEQLAKDYISDWEYDKDWDCDDSVNYKLVTQL